MNLVRTSSNVVVIGAGIGGLSAAIRLASQGSRVVVLEALGRPGGKASMAEHDGVAFDTGPSVLTMPHVFDELFAAAGAKFRDVVTLVEPTPAFLYRWPDDTSVCMYPALVDTLQSVESAFGSNARAELEQFLRYTRRIWEAAEPHFVAGPAPSFAQVLRLGFGGMAAITRIDAMRSMQRAIFRYVKHPRLRDVLLRYATYNGSDPRVAPATLNCIAWVELGLGGFGIEGGMYRLIEALVELAKARGVEIVTSSRVDSIEHTNGRATGVCAGGLRYAADTVVANADAAHVESFLLGRKVDPQAGRQRPAAPSTSGHTFVLKASSQISRTAHTVLFPDNYANEFVDLFDNNAPPRDPTVYLCAQSVAHNRPGWENGQPVFVMANAPAVGPEVKPGDTYETLETKMLESVAQAGLLASTDEVVWRRTPSALAATFPNTGGALYGAASNGMWSAFRRPANRHPEIRGLYLASGSAHPGGGVPLCALSGSRAALEAAAYMRGRS